MPFLSIIIPFNGIKRYLKDCLQSLKEENLEDVETILVLNGTKNNAEEFNDLIKEYGEDRLGLYNEDAGLAATVDGIELRPAADDFVFSEGHFIDAVFLAGALGGEASWVDDESTLVIRIPPAGE